MRGKKLSFFAIAILAILILVSCSNPFDEQTTTTTEPVQRSGTIGLTIFVKASSAPYIWAWEVNGNAISTMMGYTWSSQPKMASATTSDMQTPAGWYKFEIDSAYLSSPVKSIGFKLNKTGSDLISGQTTTFWYDNGTYKTTDPTKTTITTRDPVTIYVKASSAPYIWTWEANGVNCSELMGYTWDSQPQMSAATGLNNNSGWYEFTIGNAYLSSTDETISFKLNKAGSDINSSKTKTFWYDNGTYYDSDPTTKGGDDPTSITLFIKASSAPYIWVWEQDGKYCSELMGYSWDTQPKMTAASSSDMNDPTGYYKFVVGESYLSSPAKVICYKLNKTGSDISSGMKTTFWYDGSTYYSEDPTEEIAPVAPTVSVSPDSGEISFSSSITITCDDGNDSSISALVSVTVNNGIINYDYSDFTNNVLTIPVSNLTTANEANISVSAIVENTVGSAIATKSYTTPAESEGFSIYVKSTSAPTIWAWEDSGNAITSLMGYTWNSQPTMTTATGMYDNDGWYEFAISEEYLTGKAISFILNSGSTIASNLATTFWYDGSTCSTTDPSLPVAPTVTIKPSSDTISLAGSIVVSINDGNADISSASVTINSSTYDYSDFTSNSLTVPVSNITTSSDITISVSATATNSIGTDSDSASFVTKDVAVDNFTWDNALVYFVLTDRFNDGNSSNNSSYGRVTSGVPTLATFHGGDIKGLTEKMDYFDDLGVNAIWITAPYEQMHGWTSGKDSKFPHYAFHGYYTQDWTFMDQNMGTVDEFREFVTEAHKRGIRVVMDVVMNHTGYDNWQDMIDYDFGGFYDDSSKYNHACFATDGLYTKGDGSSWGTNWSTSNWSKWWCSWVRGFEGKWGYATPGGDDYTMSLAGLPDVVTEKSGSYSIPTFLQTKWAKENNSAYDAWRVPAASGLRQDLGIAPVEYIIKWLAAWVEEFGVDGFRCDTAKHVDKYRWGQLKDACNEALASWRNSSRADSYAKSWDEDFWMTGECFGWTNSVTGDYFTEGKFDSMINFAFNGTQWSGSGSSGSTPTTSTWEYYANLINTSSNNMLTYVSSHDTGLHRPSDMYNVGTMLCLLPGGVQIFYGDESARPGISDYYGDTDMATRGDMNFGSNTSLVAHWGKVGNFRKNHPAVGAGSQTTIASNTYGRYYSGEAGEDKVVICLTSGSTSVNVSGFFNNGETVRNAMDGQTVTVQNNCASFTATNGVILVEAAE